MATTRNYTITGSGDGTVILWDNTSKTPEPIPAIRSPLGFHHVATNRRDVLAAVSYDGKIHLFDLENLKLLHPKSLESNNSKYWAVALCFEQPLMVLTTVDGSIDIWNIENVTEPVLLGSIPSVKKGFGLSVDISPDGSTIACGQESGSLFVYDTNSLRLLLSIPGHSLPIRAVKFSPASNLLAVAGDSKLISLYTVSTGEHITNLSGHTSWIFSLAWNETGEFLLSSSYEGKAKVWSLETMKCVSTIAENDGPLLCCAWLDKEWGRGVLAGINRGVVTVGEDRAIRWYRDASGQ